MTTTTGAPSLPEHLLPDASAALGTALEDSPELRALRASAADAAARLALPSRLERPWRYSDMSDFPIGTYEPATGRPDTASPTAGDGILELVDGLIVGAPDYPTINVGGLGPRDDTAANRSLIGTAVKADTNLFTALHYAFLDGPLVIQVPDDVELTLPVRVLRRFLRPQQLAAPHTLIVTGRHARVTVIEELCSSDEPMTVLPAIEILPGPGAEVRYTVLHRWGPATNVFSDQHTITAADSAIVSLAVATGGAIVKSHVTSSMEGRGSTSEIYGLFLGSGQRHFDLYTIQDHKGADTRSDLLYKSALRDQARSVYYGLTRVGLEARNADANQENRNLLLSKTAKADSDPVLEILTNDVIRAAHGATAGPVDEGQLFYLEARGIKREDAEALLVTGFLGEVLDRIPDSDVRGELAASIGLAQEEII